MKFKKLLRKIIEILSDIGGELDLSCYAPIIDKLIPIMQTAEGIIIRLGKTNFVVRERFFDKGRTASEVLENLIVDRCRQIS